jgi:hypothetical protein
MATTKPKAKAKNPPTAKQLRARKKFAAMAKRRGREARAAKRAAGQSVKRQANKGQAGKRRNADQRDFQMNPSKRAIRRNPSKATSTHRYGNYGGHTIYAETSDYSGELIRFTVDQGAKSFYTLKEATDYIDRQPNPRRAGVVRSAARSAVHKFLTKPRHFGRKRNPAPDGIEQVHEKFLGRPTDPKQAREMVAPKGTPTNVAGLGELTYLKTPDETIRFKRNEAILAANARGDLFIVGDCRVESNADLGPLMQIGYLAKKDHLNPGRGHRKRRNGGLTEYIHNFGEEGGRPPKLKTDNEGFFHLIGGSYTIQAEGITD